MFWVSRYLEKLLQMQKKYCELQIQHNRLKKTLNLKNEKVKSLQREKSNIRKKHNQLLKAHERINATKTPKISVRFID